jgi:hypothetical protein
MVEMRWILVCGDQESEALICLPRFDKTIIPHRKDIWVDVDIFEGDRVRYDLILDLIRKSYLPNDQR